MVNGAILGCGYVGKAVAQHWRQQGMVVTATTTRSERLEELRPLADRVVVMRGDDPEALGSLLAHQHTLLICVGAGRGANYQKTYLDTAQTVLAGLDQAPQLRQIIFTSTGSVYGDYGAVWVTELDPPRPITPNGQVMVATENALLGAVSGDRQVCIFRLGGIYGPGRELVKIYSRWAGTSRPGTGQEPSNWVHREDIVGAISLAQRRSLGGLYNLVQDQILPVGELINRVCRHHGLAPVSWDPSCPSDRSYNARLSNQKLHQAGYSWQYPYFSEYL
ncbi:MAG: SDR family oxidoreductase [Nodosilinea sp.]